MLAVRSTHIYCRPSCPARRPLRRNVVFFRTREEAEKQGFRPCLRCKPNEVAGPVALVERATRQLAESGEDSVRFGALAQLARHHAGNASSGVSASDRAAPRELAEALRLARFKKMLRAGKSITDALYETGYGSSSRVYERSNAQLGMTPATYRKGGKGMKIGYSIAKSALGKVLVAATDRGVSAVYLGDAEAKLVQELKDEYPRAELAPADDSFERWVKEIVQRVEGKPPRIELPLDLQATAFQRRVWQELQRIPRGNNTHVLPGGPRPGNPKAVRAVARACATNPVSHRRAVPPSDSRRWQPGRLSLGAFAERATPGA